MARELRYDFFSNVALKLKKELPYDNPPLLVTAHHFDDQVETVLMRLFNGSGLAGLSGIRPRLIWGQKQLIEIIRPLLGFRHRQLVQYCNSNKLEFVTDPSNADINYPRNNIRHRLAPKIEEHFGNSALEGIVRSAEIIRGAHEYSNAEIDKLLADSVTNRRCCELELDYKQYSGYLRWLRLVSIKRIADSVANKTLRISYERCKMAERFLWHNQGGVLEIGSGISVTRTGNRIYFFKKPSAVKRKQLAVPGKYVIEDWGVLHLNVVELEKVDFPPPQRTLYIEWQSTSEVGLNLAPVSPGDRISLLGMKGRRKVSDYLHDSGVPVYRRRYPAVLMEDEIVAIPPFGISEKFKISVSSLQALEITWENA
jgi:tRNA(Ile)-lysidine synthase